LPVIIATRETELETWEEEDGLQPSQAKLARSYLKKTNQAWWYTPAIPATCKAGIGKLEF
jgi:hypothetical protein